MLRVVSTTCLLALLLPALTVSSANAGAVPDALRVELAALAEDIAKIVGKKGGGAVAVGAFNGSADLIGHAGPRVQRVLADELRSAKLIVDNENHRFEVTGRYQPFRDTATNRKRSGESAFGATDLNAVKLVAFLIDRDTGIPLAERPTGRLIFGSETVPSMLGVNLSSPPTGDPRELSRQIDQAKETPQYRVGGARVTGVTGQYALEVLVKKRGAYKPRSVRVEKSLPFVGLEPGEVYAVRLINNTPHEAAVDLRVDGVSSFAFSDRKSTYWIVPPKSHVDVPGWRRTKSVVSEFKVVAGFPETAAAKLRLRPSPSIGLINASFSACWATEADRPADEPAVQGRGTGLGQDIQFKTKGVKRTIGQRRDNLAIRYER